MNIIYKVQFITKPFIQSRRDIDETDDTPLKSHMSLFIDSESVTSMITVYVRVQPGLPDLRCCSR